MPEPRIKREQIIERPLSAIPSKRGGAIATLFAASSAEQSRDDDAECPPPTSSPRPLPSKAPHNSQQQPSPAKVKEEPIDRDHVDAALPARATLPEVLPQNNKLVGSRHASGRHGAEAPPVASSLSSCPISALEKPQQTVVFTKTQSKAKFTAGYYRLHLTRLLLNHYALPTYTKGIARVARMENFNFGGDDTVGGGDKMDLNTLGVYPGMPDQVSQMVTMPLATYHFQQRQQQNLQQELHMQKAIMTELYTGNQAMHAKLLELDERVAQLEQNSAPSQTLPASHTGIGVQPAAALNSNGVLDKGETDPFPSQDDAEPFIETSMKRAIVDVFGGEGVTMPGRTKYRKKLQVKIPGKVAATAPNAGLPTPMPSALQTTVPPSALLPSFPTTPRTPYTPGRIGPPDSYKKTTTSINKRDIHNLNKFIPPQNVQLPMVPLTDTEVIVYFFNSLSKPTVSLRLYARGWGPASIVQCLNDHREVMPPYLRNTCSVKCTTAIKLGRKRYGDEWEGEYRAVFADAEDPKATDLIRADEDVTVDYYVRALGVNLKKHPTGAEAGIFTACVKYCIETNASYTMSNVFQLAIDLQDDNVPQHPASPAPSDVLPAPQALQLCKQEDESEGGWTDDEAFQTPSPLAERTSFLSQHAGSWGFANLDAQHEQQDEEKA